MPVLPAELELPRTVDVLGLPICPLRTEGLIELLIGRARGGAATTVCYANAHTANLAWSDRRFRDALSGCDLLYADGASLVWASRWSERRLPERMTAADYFERFAKRCEDQGLSVYLLGGRPGVADAAAARLCAAMPKLRVAGTQHGFFKPTETPRIVAEINKAATDVLAVGLSSPRQEYWLAENREALKPPIQWCVGALFDYLAGLEQRAPAWLCKIGGEWLFRLLVDPVGKWRRYLVGNPLFVWHTLCWAMRRSPNQASQTAPARRAPDFSPGGP